MSVESTSFPLVECARWIRHRNGNDRCENAPAARSRCNGSGCNGRSVDVTPESRGACDCACVRMHAPADRPMPADACTTARLLVEVPFTAADVSVILRTHVLWSRFPPCTSSLHKDRTGLLFLFNGRCEDSSACEQVKQRLTQYASCFGDVRVQDARLSSREDRYDKLRRSASWVAGPNNLFHRAVAIAQSARYTHMFQLEPDVLPIRAGWLDRAQCLASISDQAWVIGSALRANCTREETTGTCVQLPEEFAGHINGNAIYAVGDAAFASYLRSTRQGRTGRMAYDLALHVTRNRYSQPRRRELLHRFQHSSFVVNMGTSDPQDAAALHQQFPGAYLVHNSAFSRFDASTLQARFPSTTSERQFAKAVEPALPPVNLNLAPLRERAIQLGDTRVAVVTFIAGRKYEALCRNHVLHLRRAAVSNYVLVALDTASLQWLQTEREPVIDAAQLVRGIPEEGADRFGSAGFFAINGARYRALIGMLREGISLLVLDLDVIILQDPTKWLRSSSSSVSNADMLLQSDARDGETAVELDPELLDKRLGLQGSQNWTYANGGVFFCRAGPSTVALFEAIWQQLSQSATPPNEQDVLNRELAARTSAHTLRWSVLPPALFPNGFVYFLRPIPALQPVLVHANWIDGVEQKVYHLIEAGLWGLPRASGEGLSSRERFLSIGAHFRGSVSTSFAAHRRAFRDALAIAQALNRTLILPRLPVSSTTREQARTLAHFFDYASFASAFPSHRARGPDSLQGSDATKKVHLDVGHDDAPPSSSGYVIAHVPRTSNNARNGLSDAGLRKQLAPYADAHVLQLSTAYRRFGGRFADTHEKAEFAVRAQRGLKPAPRLQVVVQFLTRAIRRDADDGVFDCIDATHEGDYAALLTGGRIHGVTTTPQSLVHAAAPMLNASRVLVVNGGLDVNARAALDIQSQKVFGGRRVVMDDLVPPWYRTDFDTPSEHATHARHFVELRLCARARRFIGNLAAPSTHAVCQMRGRKSSCDDAFGRTLPPRWAFF